MDGWIDGRLDGWVDGWVFSENDPRAVGDIGCGCKILSSLSQGKLCLHSPKRFQVLNIFSVPSSLNKPAM